MASSPASTTVTKAGPSSGRASSTIVVSAVCTSQSHVWPTSDGAARPAGQRRERRALERQPARDAARARGEHDLRAHVDREHVVLRDARALGDPRELLQVARVVRGDRGPEAARLRAHLGPVPARPVGERVVVGRDRAPDALARRLAVPATPLAGPALHADPRVHGPRIVRERAPPARATLAAPMPIQDATGLRRGLAIVEVLADHAASGGEPLGVVRIAELSGARRARCRARCGSLAETGFVERDPATRGYRIGWRLFALAARAGEPRHARARHRRSCAGSRPSSARPPTSPCSTAPRCSRS